MMKPMAVMMALLSANAFGGKISSVSERHAQEGLPRCPLNYPIRTGRIQDPELVEASGLVASRKYPGVYYSIQDSLSPSNVYAIRYDGQALGKFDLEGIKQDDWEDITMLEYNGVDYIYVGDIGGNYNGHCRGINYADMRAIRFPEPDMDQLTGGLITIPASEITVMTLKNPKQPSECNDITKQDFECMMADQFSGDIYLVQKNIYHHDVSIYKFRPTANSGTIMIQEVGKMPRSHSTSTRVLVRVPSNTTKQLSERTPHYDWPMAITGGDIARFGSRILVRNYPFLRMWERHDGQSVEDAMINNEPCEFTLKDEVLGESLAFRDDETGFVTTSDGQRHAPLYFYEFY